jgi:hypothetical protein
MPNTVDLGRTLTALGTQPDVETVRTRTLDPVTSQKIEATIDQFRTETLNQVREWLGGRAPQVTAKEAADLLFSAPALKLARAAEDFVSALIYASEAALELGSESVKDKLSGLRNAKSNLSLINKAGSFGWAAKKIAQVFIPKQLAKIETLGATYGKKWAAKLEANLPSLRQRHASTNFPLLIKGKLEGMGYRVTDAQAATLGAKAEAVSRETVALMEQLVAKFKSGDQPGQIAALLKIVGEGAISLTLGLDALAAGGQPVDVELDHDIDNLIHAVGGGVVS